MNGKEGICLSPHPVPHYHRRSDHLPRLAEATAGPEDVVLVLVATPVLVGGGSAASAVLSEGGCGIDVTGKEKKGGSKDLAALLGQMKSQNKTRRFAKLFSQYLPSTMVFKCVRRTDTDR